MATTKITSPELFDLGSLDTALQLPSGTTAERPTSPSTGEWRYNTDNNLIEYYDGGSWRDLQDEDIPPIPSENFNVVLYNGTSATHAITGLGFQPDLVWIKDRNNTESHILNDSTRGAGNDLSPNTSAAQTNRPTGFLSFDSDGFTLGTDGGGVVNDSARGPYVAWCWKANGGTTSSNSDGTITSTVQANTKTGFSIVSFTKTNGNAETIGHGLNAIPELIIMKASGDVGDWQVYAAPIGNTKKLFLNTLAAQTTSGIWNNTTPTDTVFTTTFNPSTSIIAYCFHSVAGYSKFGSYVGNLTSQTNIITGFEPAFVMIKCSSGFNSGDWVLYDNKRNPTNPKINPLLIRPFGEQNALLFGINFNTNGFSIPTTCTTNSVNQTGYTYIYIAFAADPSTAPVLADSFNTSLWTGNGTSQSITGVGFQPSLTWIKSRNITYAGNITDSLRGTTKQLYTTGTSAEQTNSTFVTSFDTDGFTVGNNAYVNINGYNFVGWNWKASPIPAINTDGTIQSIVSANQASGFSIVSYTGDGANGTVGHGLGVAPEIVLVKRLNSTGNWSFNGSVGGLTYGTNKLVLNTSDAITSDTNEVTAATSTTFTAGTSGSVGASGGTYIAYCFTSISGFSKIGSYVGNATSNRAITGLGFQPNFVMLKNTASTTFWSIFDSSRGGSLALFPNTSQVEANETGVFVSFDSDGFTVNQEPTANGSGNTIIYMAFKNNPAALPIASGEMAFLVVAGGGSGGARDAGPAGAGGLRTSYGSTSGGGASAENDITLAAGTYTITVGSGGAAIINANAVTPGNSGTDSSISATGLTTITSIAGGGGGTATLAASSGGSGGGGTAAQQPGSGTSGQGFGGGAGTGNYTSGGGGGAGQAGNTPPSNENGGDGGNGLAVTITGSTISYAGGGGGSGDTSSGSGGTGGGGAGSSDASVDATSGTANTGGGGGSHRQNLGTSGAGGSGVAILRMNTTDYSGVTTGSPTVTTDGDYTVLTYTGSGTYVHS